MTQPRHRIVLNFAKWTALSALRSGAPIKSRVHVYRLLDAVAFSDILQPGPSVAGPEFDAWHEAQTLALCARDHRVPVGWSAKLINVYLKTAAYVGDLGRPGLRDALHPPIDAGLWEGLAKRFQGRREIIDEACCVRRIKDITDYPTYSRIVAGCRVAALELGCLSSKSSSSGRAPPRRWSNIAMHLTKRADRRTLCPEFLPGPLCR